ncbi:MAG: sodium-dependent phosphate transporter [Anaerosolibacter sp.]|jgi:phosphate:Na+ symporter|uniref:Na/Pi cotransporter family protein n=1 Tax=Anaerosolibacter sp. TaxID=1872527 RepID=UPI00263058A5|nr:Na/Pi cotransporter family protein [Anaerosolibacter sp.]MDF2546295.1 sodium-dependent phosphate transporter [Anaerosolibacter sp.]
MKIIFEVLGGLGLFLYGMTIMGDGLEKAAGDKMKKIIEVLTNNRIIAVVVGALVTMIIQSSSATTVMVVGFVNAGIMTLTQATGIIMGANIGTTVTAQIASLDLNKIAPLVVGLAVGVWMFAENKKTKNIAEIFIGFGILFIGMDFMKHAVKPLKEFEGFRTMMLSFGKGTFLDSFLAVFTGFVVTAIVQSSSAATGILIALASEGFLPIEASLPIIFGTNIGTCVTAMLSSIGANRTAKRAAFIHFMFNIIGTVIFMVFFRGVTIHLVKYLTPDNAARQLANAHTFFNIVNTLLLLPFAVLLVKLANTIIPIKDYEKEEIGGIKHLDDRILETPSIAIVQVMKETINMGQLALANYKKSIDAFIDKNEKLVHDVFKQEKIINQMEQEIASYLVKLSNTALSAGQHEVVDGLFSTINDIERVGDHSDNLAELSLYAIEHDICFSDIGMAELKEIHEKVVDAYTLSLEALETGDSRGANKVIQLEGEVDALEKSLRAHHIQRLNKQQCSPESGVIFLDMLSNLERIADHASNIAMAVIDTNRK